MAGRGKFHAAGVSGLPANGAFPVPSVHFWTVGAPRMCETVHMKDLREKLEKLRIDAEDCRLISRLATDRAKRELFARLAEQLSQMAAEIEAAIAAKLAGGET